VDPLPVGARTAAEHTFERDNGAYGAGPGPDPCTGIGSRHRAEIEGLGERGRTAASQREE
jgi:hypothetical protein